jgi:hypothetical protein
MGLLLKGAIYPLLLYLKSARQAIEMPEGKYSLGGVLVEFLCFIHGLCGK